MPNDAKLGLVVGVGLVITVAVLFFRKDVTAGPASGDPAPAGIVRPLPPAPSRPYGSVRTALARPTARSGETPAQTAGAHRHTVRAGDTLFSIARQYYGDAERFGLIYQANRGVLRAPDELPAGAELVIPDAAAAAEKP